MHLNGCNRRLLPALMIDTDGIVRAAGRAAVTGFRDAAQSLILFNLQVRHARSSSRVRPGDGPGTHAGRVETRRGQPSP